MPFLTVNNASLHFEIQGQGPVLLLIAGAKGQGTVFKQAAERLSVNFTVVTYDRRGHSRSPLTGEQDYAHRLERDADDAAELIQHIISTYRPESEVYVFGTSSGAIVALTLLHRHPSIITKLIGHEPPMMNALPDDCRADAVARTRQFYELYRAKGVHTALQQYPSTNMPSEELAALNNSGDDAEQYERADTLYWFERELPVYPLIDVPWDALKNPEVKSRLIMGVSEDGASTPAGRVAQAIAEELKPGVTLETFPAGHLSYMTDPGPFASRLAQALGEA